MQADRSARQPAIAWIAWLALLAVALVCALVCDLAAPPPARGQADPGWPGQWVAFTRTDGLPDDEVMSVWVSPQGAVWAGTKSGLARFDGGDWQKVEPGAEILSNNVQALWGRDDQDLWAASDAGLAHFDGQAWQTLPLESGGASLGPVYALWGDAQGGLWIGAKSGAAYYDGASLQVFTPQNSPLPGAPVYALAGSPDGRAVWLGGLAGLARYDPASRAWETLAPQDTGPGGFSVQALFQTPQALWVGALDGLWRYDLASQAWTFQDGRAWDGPDGVVGLWVDGPEVWLAASIIHSPTHCLSDREIQLEKSRQRGGLRHFDGQRWQSLDPQPDGERQIVYALSVEEGGVFWIAAQTGLTRYDSRRWQVVQSASPLGIELRGVRGDDQGHVWLAGRSELYEWQGERWLRHSPPDWPQ